MSSLQSQTCLSFATQSHRPSFQELKSKVAGIVNTDEFLDYDWAPSKKAGVPLPKDHTRASTFALGAATEALQDAKLDAERSADSLNDSRAGVSMGVGLPAVWQGGRAGVLVSQVQEISIHAFEKAQLTACPFACMMHRSSSHCFIAILRIQKKQ